MSDGTRTAERLAVRLTKGALVAVLAGGLTATAAVAHTATVAEAGPSVVYPTGTTGVAQPQAEDTTDDAVALVQARTAVVDVATDAVEVAHDAQSAGKATEVDATELKKLKTATAKLEALVEKARANPVPDPVAATPSPSASSSAAPSADVTAPSPDAPAPSADASVPAADASSSPVDEAAAAAPSAAPRAPTVDGPLTSAAETPLMLGQDEGEQPASDEDAATDDLASVDDLVVPDVTGPEDATTAQLRDALASIVVLAGSVEDTAEANKKADEAAARQAAAQRAAWKKSLQGYANGQIPSSALCRPSFDSTALLRCDASQALEQLNTAFRAEFGRNITMTDSYRSYAGQVSCRIRKGSLCAVPGTSNHGTGVAVDFASGIQTFGSREHAWMDDHAAEYGWQHPAWAESSGSKPEAWHWEYQG